MAFSLKMRFPGSDEFVDVSDYVLAHDEALATKKWQQDEKPTLEFWLAPDLLAVSAFQIPVRGTEVRFDCDTYPNFFTGFVTTDQQLEPQGANSDDINQGIYGYKVDCTDEAILLDMQYVGNVQPFINMTEGDILASLIQQLVPGRFDTSALVGWGDPQPYFAVTSQQAFTDIQKALLANKAAMLRFERGVVTLARYWDVAPYVVMSETDDSYVPYDLTMQVIPQSIRNDLTGVGAVEPQAYVKEYAVGDGFNGLFPLGFMPFGETDTPLLNDTFTQALSTSTWNLDPAYNPPGGAAFDVTDGALNATGEEYTYGTAFLYANLGIELAGKLRICAGEFQFEAASDGLVGVLTTVNPQDWLNLTNEEALAAVVLGWKFTPNGSNTDIQPIVNGELVGDIVTTAAQIEGIVPATYTLNIFFASNAASSTSQNWYSDSQYFVEPAPTSSVPEVSFQVTETPTIPVGLPVTTQTSTIIAQQTQTPVVVLPPTTAQVAIAQLLDAPDFVYYIEWALGAMNAAVNNMEIDQPIQMTVTDTITSEQVIQFATVALPAAGNLATLELSLPPTEGNTLVVLATSWSAAEYTTPEGFDFDLIWSQSCQGGTRTTAVWTRVVELDDPQEWLFSVAATGGTNMAMIEVPGAAVITPQGSVGDDAGVVNGADLVSAGAGLTGVDEYGSLALWLIEWGGPADCTLATAANSTVPGDYSEPEDVEVLQTFGVDPAHGVALVSSFIPENDEVLALNLNDTPTAADVWVAVVCNIPPNAIDEYVGEPGDPEADCTIMSTNSGATNVSGAALSFFSNDVPSAQTKIAMRYRAAGLSIARVVDNASIADEAERFGDNGDRAQLITSFDPQAYSSIEVETRLQAMLDDLTQEQYQGTWKLLVPNQYVFTQEPRPGVFATMTLPTRLHASEDTLQVLPITVTTEVLIESSDGTEIMRHTIAFGEFTSLRLDELLVQFNAQTISPEVAQISQTMTLQPIDTTLIGTQFCDDLPDAVLVSQSQSLFTIDSGRDLELGERVEVRTSDANWGTNAVNNLVVRSSTRIFDVPRNSRIQVYYLKLLAGTASPAGGVVSRYPTVIRISYPLIPAPPVVTLYDQSDFLHPIFLATIVGDPADVFEVQWAVGSKGQIAKTKQYVSDNDLQFVMDNVNGLWTTEIYCRFINLLSEPCDWTPYQMVIPYPTVWNLHLDPGNSSLDWTNDPYSSTGIGDVTFGNAGIGGDPLTDTPGADTAGSIELNVGGESGYIQAPPGDWFPPAFSIELWCYPISNDTNQYLFWSGSDAGKSLQNSVEIYWSDGLVNQPGVRMTGPVDGQILIDLTCPNPLALNTWHHIAITWDGDTLSLYVDGTAVTSGQLAGSVALRSVPSIVIVQPTSSGYIWQVNPAADAANLYMIASDSGVTADVYAVTATPDAVIALTPDTVGNFQVAHGLGQTPQVVIPQMTSSGLIFGQATIADDTNLYLTSTDPDATGVAIVWVLGTTLASSFVTLDLESTSQGAFSVAHGMAETPSMVIVVMTSLGAIWPIAGDEADDTSINLSASEAGLTGVAYLWA